MTLIYSVTVFSSLDIMYDIRYMVVSGGLSFLTQQTK